MKEYKYCKVLMNCYNCGNDVEVYGPFNTEKEAEKFNDYPEKDTIDGMSCLTKKIVEIRYH